MVRENHFIEEISRRSNKVGDKLLELMDYCNVSGLKDVPLEKAKEFLDKLTEEETSECHTK